MLNSVFKYSFNKHLIVLILIFKEVKMKNSFYINKNAQPTGEHEIHKFGCSYLPSDENRVFLGYFDSFEDANQAAIKAGFSNVDGCAFCCPEGHRR